MTGGGGSGPVPRRVVLVGFMGSGKTSVGRALARLLGWQFQDFDEAIEEEVGLAVPQIFEVRGEAYFRRVEERAGRRLLGLDKIVLASGGGWPTAPGRMDSLPAGTLSVWLRVSAEVAVERVRKGVGGRPLLDVADPLGEARRLLALREPYYRGAGLHVDSESGDVEAVSASIARHVSGMESENEEPGLGG